MKYPTNVRCLSFVSPNAVSELLVSFQLDGSGGDTNGREDENLVDYAENVTNDLENLTDRNENLMEREGNVTECDENLTEQKENVTECDEKVNNYMENFSLDEETKEKNRTWEYDKIVANDSSENVQESQVQIVMNNQDPLHLIKGIEPPEPNTRTLIESPATAAETIMISSVVDEAPSSLLDASTEQELLRSALVSFSFSVETDTLQPRALRIQPTVSFDLTLPETNSGDIKILNLLRRNIVICQT